MTVTTEIQPSTTPPIISLHKFCRDAGISTITAWRFRKRGWLETVNVAGRQYLTGEGIAKFKHRATSGEFAQKHVTPPANARA